VSKTEDEKEVLKEIRSTLNAIAFMLLCMGFFTLAIALRIISIFEKLLGRFQ